MAKFGVKYAGPVCADIRRDRLDPVSVGPWSGLDSGRVFGLSDFFFYRLSDLFPARLIVLFFKC